MPWKPSACKASDRSETTLSAAICACLSIKTPDTPDGLWKIDYDGLFAPIIKAEQELKGLFDGDHEIVVKLQADDDDLRAELKAVNDNEAAQIKALTARLDVLEAARR